MGADDQQLPSLDHAEPSAVAVRIEGIRHAARRRVSRSPALYLPLARRKYPDAVLAADTALVIDGFTRSAVTFAVVAFQLTQNDHVRVAHHLHAAAHVIAAARRGVPTLVSVRDPADSILSALIREPRVGAEQLLRSYADFHERIGPYRAEFVAATFEEVTSDFGAVTRRINDRFGTSFSEFPHTDENVARCFEVIEERSSRPAWERLLGKMLSGRLSMDQFTERTAGVRDRTGAKRVPEHRVQRPSVARSERKTGIRDRYDDPRLAALRARARSAYDALMAP